MTKIEEIIERNRNKTDHYADQEFSDFGNISVESAMKEYAEYYAKKVLEIVTVKVRMKWEYVGDGSDDGMQIIDKDPILNIKLPEHD